MSQNTTFRSQKQRFEARDPYKESYKAAKKAQEEKPKEEQPAPLNDGFLSQEQRKLLDELLQNQKERDEREKMARESRQSQFDELSSQLQRPGNQAKAKGGAVEIPIAMNGWFVFPKGASDDDSSAIRLLNKETDFTDEETMRLAFELGNCEKELTDRIIRCSFKRDTVFGKNYYRLSSTRMTLTEFLKDQEIKPERALKDGVYPGALINQSTSTRSLPMVLSASTLSLGDEVLLAIEPSYTKVKIATFTVENGAVVEDTPTIELKDLPLPSSAKQKK